MFLSKNFKFENIHHRQKKTQTVPNQPGFFSANQSLLYFKKTILSTIHFAYKNYLFTLNIKMLEQLFTFWFLCYSRHNSFFRTKFLHLLEVHVYCFRLSLGRTSLGVCLRHIIAQNDVWFMIWVGSFNALVQRLYDMDGKKSRTDCWRAANVLFVTSATTFL